MISKETFFSHQTINLIAALNSRLSDLGQNDAEAVLKFVLTIWHKYEHRELIEDMSENGLSGDEYIQPLYEITDLESEYSDLVSVICALKMT